MAFAAPPRATFTRRWAWTTVLALAGVVVVLLWRRTDALLNPQLVAEDGPVFFLGAYEQPFRLWFSPYAGYLHLTQRIVADLALLLDPRWIPAAFAWSATGFYLVVAARLLSPRLELPESTRLALVAGLALVPHTGEVWAHLTNVHWVLALVLVILAAQREPENRWEWSGDVLLLILAGLSGPFSLFLAPLWVLQALRRRTWRTSVLTLVVLTTAAIQLHFLLDAQEIFTRTTPAEPAVLAPILGGRLFGTIWGGYQWPVISTQAGWLMVLLGGAAALAWAAWRRGPYHEWRSVLGVSWLLLTLPVAAKFIREAAVISSPVNGDRYFFQPHVLTIFLLVILVTAFTGWLRWATVALLLAFPLGNARSYRTAALPDYGWGQHVAAIRVRGPIYITIPHDVIIPSAGRPGYRERR